MRDLPFPGDCGFQKTLPPRPRVHEQWNRYFPSFWFITNGAGNSFGPKILAGNFLFYEKQRIWHLQYEPRLSCVVEVDKNLHYDILDIQGDVAKVSWVSCVC